jgi:hypothetical protein
VDGCDNRFGRTLHPIEQPLLTQRRQFTAFLRTKSREFLDVRPGDEGLLARPRHGDNAHRSILLGPPDGVRKGGNHSGIERIERFRAVDGQRQQTVIEVF